MSTSTPKLPFRPAAAVVPAVPAEPEPFLSRTMLNLGLMVLIWSSSSFLLPKMFPAKFPSPAVVQQVTSDVMSEGGAAGLPRGIQTVQRSDLKNRELRPLWNASTLLDFHLQLSHSETPQFDPAATASIKFEGIVHANDSFTREWKTTWSVPESVQNNGSFYLDVFVTRSGVSPATIVDDSIPLTEGEELGMNDVHVYRKILTRFMPQRRVRAVKNLISGASVEAEEEVIETVSNDTVPVLSYYHPNLTLILVQPGPIFINQLPPVLKAQVTVTRDNFYAPLLTANDFWLMNSGMNPVNSTTTELPLHVTLIPSSYMKFQIFSTLDEAFTKQSGSMGGGELDELKRMLTETSAWLLITTFVVSALHMIFEFLAFTSDISHWKSKKELVGVSVRTIVSNVIVQLVILLYLLDNNEKTSWMILGGQGMGLVIEAWKISKAVNIRVIPTVPEDQSRFPYRIEVTDKHVLTEDELKTQVYDKLAFKYVTYGVSPFLLGYTIYSLIYNEHRSYYSFILTTATTMVYSFGFINLIPQLIINHKLRSVAHIPRKTMIYKFLNTIVDDFGAVIIKQPLLARLGAFRDDVVFIVLLYQMWIYRTDYSRANEFGQQLTPEAATKLVEDKAVESIESKKDI